MFFLQYGPIVEIDLKIPPRPPGYAFVEVSATVSEKIITNTIFLVLINYQVLEFRIQNISFNCWAGFFVYFTCTEDSKYDFVSSLKILAMLMMPFVVVMVMILMDVDYG